jgi:hypothetical protein
MTEKTLDQLVKGMPAAQQGRGRTIYKRGRRDAAQALGTILHEHADNLDDGQLLHLVSLWIKGEKEEG